ncbi:hypothetical protein CEUSTIGMA_g11624.t1 [Chlamydomonas eustigma]|uniref:TsaA-like domain-containing protein n=1 Tax=Chlamydomonas eustigma TaxID=1157962 RepID=A0A250XM72_9CHLO|nr:hypothetical protein CEUSTIGMA_g11624.t1 [Chlamydomonas eustigma]|eukprot:GAX84201.1 hypothetical protein CEUSTIGMA_g11624.t1 [Chlamydomonas eustigma]
MPPDVSTHTALVVELYTVISVEDNGLVLGGADLVDGSPILDIKPYLPFCDGVTHATAPAWVTVEAEDEPLKVGKVLVPESARQMIHTCWLRSVSVGKYNKLYSTSDGFLQLIEQVLSRDIRPVHRRIPSPLWSETPSDLPAVYEGTELSVGQYHVVLENIDVSYDMHDDGKIVVRGACPNVVQSQQRGLGLLKEYDNEQSQHISGVAHKC